LWFRQTNVDIKNLVTTRRLLIVHILILNIYPLFTDNNNNASTNSNCGTTNMNKRHCDDSSLTPSGSRIPLSRSCSSPAVSHGELRHEMNFLGEIPRTQKINI